ncbi:unnamed protein product [Thelazia callipaeda]|uniref:Uncharacterized protein n=1 Tax=Thelazia callipaeda TaxID=103827 RepID=A0A0N5D6A7_THECL|nr:unnamed protein product [Thelazia callipaeda]
MLFITRLLNYPSKEDKKKDEYIRYLKGVQSSLEQTLYDQLNKENEEKQIIQGLSNQFQRLVIEVQEAKDRHLNESNYEHLFSSQCRRYVKMQRKMRNCKKKYRRLRRLLEIHQLNIQEMKKRLLKVKLCTAEIEQNQKSLYRRKARAEAIAEFYRSKTKLNSLSASWPRRISQSNNAQTMVNSTHSYCTDIPF